MGRSTTSQLVFIINQQVNVSIITLSSMGHLNGIRWPRNTAKKLMDPSSKAEELTQFENQQGVNG